MPPVLVSVSPESGAVNVTPRSVVFAFDEVIADRASGQNALLEDLFVISPRDGVPRVSWERDRVEVRPRRRWLPNTAYSVTMLPGIVDFRNNVLRESRTIVFSTGPSIPPHSILGRIFDWESERAAANAYVEAIRLPDSVTWVGFADSTGQFAVGPLEPGRYVVRAVIDGNRNRGLDRGEPWDTVAVDVRESSPFLELLALVRDTIAPRLLTVSVTDTLTLVAAFDRPVDPAELPTPASFRVVGADSAVLRVLRVASRSAADSARAVSDSIARDSAARRDTARVDPAQARRDSLLARLPGAERQQLRPSRRPPAKDFFLYLDPATPLRRGAAYRVTAFGVRGILGQRDTTERIITVPAARPDTGAARPVPP